MRPSTESPPCFFGHFLPMEWMAGMGNPSAERDDGSNLVRRDALGEGDARVKRSVQDDVPFCRILPEGPTATDKQAHA